MSSGEKYGIAAELLALAFGMVQGMIGTIPPLVGWPIVVACVIAGAVLIIRGRQGRYAKQQELGKLLATAHLEGSIEGISQGDALWIVGKTIDMRANHGHDDFWGLTADRASGVPLNELMERECSRCGVKRKLKYRKTDEL